MIIIMKKKVFVSGCYDLLHSGHVEFFQQASQYGDLYVGIGSDATYLEYKHRKPMFPQEERLFMVKNIKAVKDAYINEGSGVIDFLPTLDKVKPDVFVVNAEGGSDEKRRICKERGIEYVELQRTPHAGLKARSSSDLKKALSNVSENTAQEAGIPTRLDLAGTWIDQPYVSMYHPGWAITISLEPTFEVRDRCGLSTSTRKMIQKIWPVKLPKMDPEMLARLVFCFENNPERHDGIISGAQDSIGICVPGLVRHYYDNNFWPEKIESTQDEMTLRFLEGHLVMIPMEPRRPGCSVVEGKDITPEKVKALADAADACWKAILAHDLDAFAAAYRASFEAQIAMFPGMVNPSINGMIEPEASVQPMRVMAFGFGMLTLFLYVAAQTGVNSFFINYAEESIHIEKQTASLYLAFGGMGLFFIGRLAGGVIMNYIQPRLVLLACAIITFVATLIVVVCSGTLSLIAFFALYLGESIMFPTIFSLALRDAGTKTKLASSLLIMTIVGGAVAPVIMGYIADTTGSMAIAFLIPLVCYGVIGGYALSNRHVPL